jgi:hypothetical protein
MEITLTKAELAVLSESAQGEETVEETFHRLMLPKIAEFSEARLIRLNEQYRALTPELQLEALEVLRRWQQTKT